MNDPENYLIAANDEHGVNPPTAGKRTPIMPYLERSIYENEFNRATKLYFMQACLRNGFRVFDVKPEEWDVPLATRARRVNLIRPSLLVTFAYNAFGTGATFNAASGFETFYSLRNPQPERSRQLAEEIFEQLAIGTPQRPRRVGTLDITMLSSVVCPAALVEAGFMTNPEEAKRMLDPDYRIEVAEETCKGVAMYLNTPYIGRDDRSVYPLLRRGGSGRMVELMQLLLDQNGCDLVADGIFGAKTEACVRAFQRENGLVEDGLVGDNTWRTLLVFAPRPTLAEGSRGAYVRYLQQKLESKLYPVGTVDGIFGSKIKNAVMAFQRENGLEADGIVGPRTWAALEPIGGGRSEP